MDDYFLTPFFYSLKQAGIQVGIREYIRISGVLQTAGKWNLKQFKNMLLSILAKSDTEQKIFLEQFDTFFK